MNQCAYCNQTLANRRNLKRHINSTSYCLALRGMAYTEWQCGCCEGYFSSKYVLAKHEPRCRLIAQGIHKKKLIGAKPKQSDLEAENTKLKKENAALKIIVSDSQETIRNLEKENTKLEKHLIVQGKIINQEKLDKKKQQDNFHKKMKEIARKALESTKTD